MPKIPKQRTGSGGWPDRARVPAPKGGKGGGCMMLLIAPALAVLALASLLGGCRPEPSVKREPVPTVAASTAALHVKALCDFFHARPLEVLGTSGAEGNVTLLADQPGIPPQLRADAIGYYDGGFGGRPDTAAHREVLTQRYGGVIADCKRAGWKPA